MARELRFTDPAFRCEVVLSGTAVALYEAARPQLERLKGLKSLGLMAHIHDIAMHTRHQHLVGLMRIFNKLCQQPPDKGLPKAFLWSFWCRLCFGQAGHAALGYDSEKAILLACHLDSNFKALLRSLMEPVVNKLAACPTCTRRSCKVREKGKDEAGVWFDEIVVTNRWRRLHFWFAALKLIQEPDILPILSGQKAGSKNPLGFSDIEAFKMLVAPECEWERALNNLCRLDHVVRDLAFAGTLGIQLDVDNLVSAPDDPLPDWGLLGSLNTYLIDTLYESIRAQTASVLFQRALATILIDRRVTIEALFGLDLDQALNDEELTSLIRRQKAGKEVFDPDRREAWRTWPISTYIDRDLVPCEIEKTITGHDKGHLTRHISSRATCLKLRQAHNLGIVICHRSLADRPAARAFVKLCRSILNRQYPKLASEELTGALFEGLVNRQCRHGLHSAAERLSQLPMPLAALRKAGDFINKRISERSEASGEFSFKIGGYEYPVRSDPQALQLNMMHASLSGDDSVRKNLGIKVEEAAELLWHELLDWQSMYFSQRPSQKVMALVEEAQSQLAKQVVEPAPSAETDLELYALLEALKHPSDTVSFRVVLPNLKLLKEDGATENEYDVVSVALKDDKDVEVWVWEVTTKQDLTSKRNEDMARIQRLKDLLGGRWETDVRVVTNYIHKDGTDICCEIDGRQSRRHVASI